ncbi:MAG: T9SS type A sorting domain-containing protein [Chitinophagales bacterium]
MKNRKTFIVMLSILFANILFGQSDTIYYFKQKYDLVGDNIYVFNSGGVERENYYGIITNESNVVDNEKGIWWRKIAKDTGETIEDIRVKTTQLGVANYHGSEIIDKGNSVVLSFVENQLTDAGTIMRDINVLEFNNDGEIEWNKKYGEKNSDEGSFDLSRTKEGGYIIGGFKTNQETNFPYLIKIDSVGNVEWERVYPTEIQGAALYVYPTYDGGYIFSGYRGKGNPFAPYQNCYVTRVDSVGNVVWDKVYQEDTEDILNTGGRAIPIPNTNNYLLSYKYGKDEKRYQFVGAIDDTGTVLWGKDYQYTAYTTSYFTELYFQSDGGFISAGHQANENNPNRTEPFIMRFNSEGDTLWTKRIAIEPSENQYIRGFLSTSDGGYLLTGLSFDKGYAWEVKIDSLGNTCWQTGCDSTYVEVVGLEEPSGLAETATVLVSPNPAQDNITISLPKQVIDRWEIANIQGHIVLSGNEGEIVTESLVSGVYIIKVYTTENELYVEKIIIAR